MGSGPGATVGGAEPAFRKDPPTAAKGTQDRYVFLTLLREEMEQWLEEAQDASKQETLENVVGHLEVMEEEYHRRRRMLGDE